MSDFAASYLGRLRAVVGSRKLLVVGARVVIENPRGLILLQQRSDFRVWGLPGGNCEEGDDIEETARREVREETGLQIRSMKPFGFGSDPAYETITFPNGDVSQFFVMMFHATDYVGEPDVRDCESLAVSWFETDLLPDMLPNMTRSVQAFRRFRSTGDFQLI